MTEPTEQQKLEQYMADQDAGEQAAFERYLKIQGSSTALAALREAWKPVRRTVGWERQRLLLDKQRAVNG